MSGETMHTPGPWKFEPHGGYGSEIDGVAFPFGYISTAHPQPIFELSPVLEFKATELEANARLIAAAPDLLAALTALDQVLDLDPDEESVAAFAKQLGIENPSSLADAIALTRAALALATGGRENG